MSGCYDILYLHLGSNDVCCKDSNFYRCVTEILDVVFSVCTEIHVVLCVILPRDFDVRMFPRWPLSGAQLRNYCQWIRSANSMLWELSHHVPSVRYMDYAATKQKSLYLSHDGLHLSAEGARRCLASIHDDLPNQLCVEAAVQDPTEWPALSATEVPVQEHDSTIALFSDIVQTGNKDFMENNSWSNIEGASCQEYSCQFHQALSKGVPAGGSWITLIVFTTCSLSVKWRSRFASVRMAALSSTLRTTSRRLLSRQVEVRKPVRRRSAEKKIKLNKQIC
ncbi:uncharacterized protein LOC127851560 [Dreissena polymorpha]|uniref:uncharacterized protein LOC127851560 n=1 Tax=Dreissena polymorpha TaxID=45954 RepID=UPI002264039B|nr:uncharacterized protein LOC127851560 [Dreissena polymorpha]